MSITERMENDGLSFGDAAAKESLVRGDVPMSTTTEALLAERGKTHGKFEDHAAITQELKRTFYRTVLHRQLLNDVQREAVDMILHKLGRIAAGNPNFIDHWDDIAGYAKLVSLDLARAT